ncbi:MAG: Fur family transcriptional regulator [Acidimicrobiales bacterium]
MAARIAPPAGGADGAAAGELHTTVAQRLRADEQRYTPGRRALVEVLAAAGRPLTVDEVLGADDSLAQSSAYRNLGVLERAGVVHRVVTADEFARYELDEALTGHHHHLICSVCGSVADFTVDADLERALADSLAAAARRHGFAAEHHRLDLVGLCADCAAAGR